MAALRVFWAKSLLNKGVVLGLVFLVCCCPVGLAGRGGRSAATAPTATPTEAPAAAVEVDEPTATAAPTETAEPTEAPTATPEPEPTVTPAPAADIYNSRGLGLSRAAFEATHGDATVAVPGFYDYGSAISVAYYDDRVWQLEHSLGEPGVPVSEARDLARLWLPQDAELVETYTSPFGQLVDLYHSPSLVERFPDDNWTNGKPGDHIVIYRRNDGSELVFGLVVGTGNNP